MKKEEFVTNFAVGDKLISVGLDDYGQCYFIEGAEDGEIKEESCGSYNTDYKGYIEYRFGEPAEHCKYYPKENIFNSEIPELKDCDNRGTFGWCDNCKYNDIKWYSHKLLVELGIIDRRGNILEPFQNYLEKRDDKS